MAQRGLNRQPRWISPGEGTRPGMAASCLRPAPSTGTDLIRAWVYGCKGAYSRSFTGACSTIWPAYMTATRLAISLTMARL